MKCSPTTQARLTIRHDNGRESAQWLAPDVSTVTVTAPDGRDVRIHVRTLSTGCTEIGIIRVKAGGAK